MVSHRRHPEPALREYRGRLEARRATRNAPNVADVRVAHSRLAMAAAPIVYPSCVTLPAWKPATVEEGCPSSTTAYPTMSRQGMSTSSKAV